ncbi:hypothetical protein LDENG_00257300 [Lucifuga dentata]|nr:hypothetical protein LDENG_00257300 [Lucifuga dentata]
MRRRKQSVREGREASGTFSLSASSCFHPVVADRRPPIRPAKPPPVITASDFVQETPEEPQTQQDPSESGSALGFTSCCVSERSQTDQRARTRSHDTDDLLTSESRPHPHAGAGSHKTAATENTLQKPKADDLVSEKPNDPSLAATTRPSPENLQKPKGDVCVSETANHLPASERAETEITKPSPGKHAHTTLKRSWNVFAQKSVSLQSFRSLSKQFQQTVSTHRLQLCQRAKWVICQRNCGRGRSIEQVWRSLNRALRRSRLPSCNTNIQRERLEIWVFCDVASSELLGRFLKEELQLSGCISLSVHRHADVFNM